MHVLTSYQHIMIPTKNMTFYVKHWLVNYETSKKKSHQVPIDSPFVFSKLQNFLLLEFKGLDAPLRNSERDIDYESRLKATQ